MHRFASPKGLRSREVIVAWSSGEETDFEVPLDARKARVTSMLGEVTKVPVSNGRLRIRLTGAPTYIERL